MSLEGGLEGLPLRVPTRAFGGRALREHRRSSGSIPSGFREQEDDQTGPRFSPFVMR
jgi:hypothetical protein